ncbi:MAG: bifunctional DNA-formamidopyrimidine glycosylase/DNA-(apurinic or apyrimidinic site) lyase [Gemmatimonadetes bacterium]|nr:bifunctional DNA-formamidopyrimidine glycosylase/DNA-(apurinic or apyrimidinic site) lyase [Gemmatimonadota bacterium]
MPELPETETISRDLSGLITGLRILGARVTRPDVLRRVDPLNFAGRLAERTVSGVHRRAKTICVRLDDHQVMLTTPRFTGALLFDIPADPYACLALVLSDEHELVYRDVRRLGTVTLLDAEGYRQFDEGLGVEPLEESFTGEALSGIVRGVSTPIKKVLMEQRRIAGIGNIYANEALWLAGIDPSRPSQSLVPTESAALVDELRGVLSASIAARGTTFRDYRDASGGQGGFAARLQCYGRGGLPCPRCRTRLTETHAIDGRSTVFCHRCQR